jgi:hydroxymethylpyrimidine kinase/phosphomethylpyrimidine kinase
MTIAGSDSGGGAGIEADLRTFAALGVHGTVALTAVTAQNTLEVRAVCALEPEMVRCQIETVTDDFAVAAVKTGMLARPATIYQVAALAREGRLPRLVVDPVLVSSSGHPLMEAGGAEAYRDALLPAATVATPNLREAAVLAGVDVRELTTVDAMVEVGRALLALGPRHVLVKGGHFAEGSVTEQRAPDVLIDASGHRVFDAERVDTSNDHGTGCSLAAAITARLALGDDVGDAVSTAKAFVLRSLRGAAPWHLGRGHGPIDHLGWNQ